MQNSLARKRSEKMLVGFYGSLRDDRRRITEQTRGETGYGWVNHRPGPSFGEFESG